jgi:hypothetical protein
MQACCVRDKPRDAFSEVPGALPTCWAFRVGKSSDRVAIDAAFLRVGTARGFLQARSYARARLNKGRAYPRIWDQVAGRLTEIAPVGFVLPKSQKRLQVLRFTVRGSSYVSHEQYTAGAVSRFDPFHAEINSQQGERFIRSALQPAVKRVTRGLSSSRALT